jgi:hypothetical protein
MTASQKPMVGATWGPRSDHPPSRASFRNAITRDVDRFERGRPARFSDGMKLILIGVVSAALAALITGFALSRNDRAASPHSVITTVLTRADAAKTVKTRVVSSKSRPCRSTGNGDESDPTGSDTGPGADAGSGGNDDQAGDGKNGGS